MNTKFSLIPLNCPVFEFLNQFINGSILLKIVKALANELSIPLKLRTDLVKGVFQITFASYLATGLSSPFF